MIHRSIPQTHTSESRTAAAAAIASFVLNIVKKQRKHLRRHYTQSKPTSNIKIINK